MRAWCAQYSRFPHTDLLLARSPRECRGRNTPDPSPPRMPCHNFVRTDGRRARTGNRRGRRPSRTGRIDHFVADRPVSGSPRTCPGSTTTQARGPSRCRSSSRWTAALLRTGSYSCSPHPIPLPPLHCPESCRDPMASLPTASQPPSSLPTLRPAHPPSPRHIQRPTPSRRPHPPPTTALHSHLVGRSEHRLGSTATSHPCYRLRAPAHFGAGARGLHTGCEVTTGERRQPQFDGAGSPRNRAST